MKKNISWNENGWTVLQDADAERHILEISCLAENGVVTQIRKRHNDGEEIKIIDKLDASHHLPMPLADFKTAFLKKQIDW